MSSTNKNAKIEIESMALIDASSIETPKRHSFKYATLEAALVLRLEVKSFTTDQVEFGHQLMLDVVSTSAPVTEARLQVNHLFDLGVLRFTTEEPPANIESICRSEKGHQMWVSTRELKRVWLALTDEIKRYESMMLEPPVVASRKRLCLAVVNMDYFNDFMSTELHTMPDIYETKDKKISRMTPAENDFIDTPMPPALFVK